MLLNFIFNFLSQSNSVIFSSAAVNSDGTVTLKDLEYKQFNTRMLSVIFCDAPLGTTALYGTVCVYVTYFISTCK